MGCNKWCVVGARRRGVVVYVLFHHTMLCLITKAEYDMTINTCFTTQISYKNIACHDFF